MSGAQVQGRRRGHRARPTPPTTAWPPPSGPATSARPTPSPTASGPARSGSTATTSSTPPPRSAASRCQRHRPRAGREGARQLHRAQDGDDRARLNRRGLGTLSRRASQRLKTRRRPSPFVSPGLTTGDGSFSVLRSVLVLRPHPNPPPQGGREPKRPPPLWGRVGVGGMGKATIQVVRKAD